MNLLKNPTKQIITAIALTATITSTAHREIQAAYSYHIVDTGVTTFYSNNSIIPKPPEGAAFYGQDAHYQTNMPSYTDNGDGTITDNVTGLMWQQDMGKKLSFSEAFTMAEKSTLAGHGDWRVPTIKELYSLIQFTGESSGEKAKKFFIDTNYFKQPIGNAANGEREIDAQTWSATEYTGKTMQKSDTVFGVNFIDGRIKGYPKNKTMYIRFVRGNPDYGKNNFVDNKNGTITDLATGLMWQAADDGKPRDWENALDYANKLNLSGYSDWRLPSAKELQSIVDYTRSPQATKSPAIDPMFSCTAIKDPSGKTNYPYYWTSTTHLDGPNPFASAVYIAFGEALGKMNGIVMNVHGAGAQRSDPKQGNAADYPKYIGPQGDLRVLYNYVRCVRTVK